MKRIDTYHTEGGVQYKGTATIQNSWDGVSAGFNFCPLDGPSIKCKIPGGSNDIINRATGLKIGEYDPNLRRATLHLEATQ